MKKCFLFMVILTVMIIGCEKPHKEEVIKIAMVTDQVGIDDKSFNQGTWEGVLEFASKHDNIETKYIQPSGGTLQDYTEAIDNLVMSGNEIIVVAGYVFEEAIEKASVVYPDVDFVLIDGVVEADNVASIKFAEHEAGFLAGVVSALETKTGKIGYMGGIEVPAVVAYGVGFQYGVDYANENLGANAEVVDYVYSGTFTDFNIGQTLSAGMFDKGVDIIMGTAGVATQGAIAEAKQRGDVYIVGCDSDQYADGIKEDGKSVVLTSAMKHIDVAVQEVLTQWLVDKFPGGDTLVMNGATNGVGLPNKNPSVSEETLSKVEEVKALMKQGEIEIPCE